MFLCPRLFNIWICSHCDWTSPRLSLFPLAPVQSPCWSSGGLAHCADDFKKLPQILPNTFKGAADTRVVLCYTTQGKYFHGRVSKLAPIIAVTAVLSIKRGRVIHNDTLVTGMAPITVHISLKSQHTWGRSRGIIWEFSPNGCSIVLKCVRRL